MGAAEMTIRVQRRFGEVEIELTGEPLVQFYCHCDDCQAVQGAAYAPESVYPSDAATVVRGGPIPYLPGLRGDAPKELLRHRTHGSPSLHCSCKCP
jgi:hypothetical protein